MSSGSTLPRTWLLGSKEVGRIFVEIVDLIWPCSVCPRPRVITRQKCWGRNAAKSKSLWDTSAMKNPDLYMTVGAELVAIAAYLQARLDLATGQRFYTDLQRRHKSNIKRERRIKRLISSFTRVAPPATVVVRNLGDTMSDFEKDALLTYDRKAFAWILMMIGAIATWAGSALSWRKEVDDNTPWLTSIAVLAIAAFIGFLMTELNKFLDKRGVGAAEVQPQAGGEQSPTSHSSRTKIAQAKQTGEISITVHLEWVPNQHKPNDPVPPSSSSHAIDPWVANKRGDNTSDDKPSSERDL